MLYRPISNMNYNNILKNEWRDKLSKNNFAVNYVTLLKCDWILETVPNHTCLFQYIYHCNMKSIAFPIIFHSTTRNSMLKLLKEYKKYSVNTYT